LKKKIEQDAAEMLAGASMIGMMTDLCKECDVKEDLGVAIKALRQYVEKGVIDEAYIDDLDELYDIKKKQ